MQEKLVLKDDERLDYLLSEPLRIIQSKDVFSFSLDAVLLSKFTEIPVSKEAIIDLCSGNGVIPLFLSQRTPNKIIGVEIQEKLVDMAKRSFDYNNLSEKLSIIHTSIIGVERLLGTDKYDLVVCNPPYFKNNLDSEKNKNVHFAIARHEIFCNLSDVVSVSSKLLKQGGKLSLVYRPERFLELMFLLREYALEPKRVKFIYPKISKEANVILVDAVKGGKPGLKFMKPFIVYSEENIYTKEMEVIVNGG